MFERFAKDVRRVVLTAAGEAYVGRGDPLVGTEHLLVGAVGEGDPVTVEFNLTPEAVRSALREWDMRALRHVGIEAGSEALGPPPVPIRRFSLLSRRHVPFSRGAKQALQRSLQICIAEGHRAITVPHLLAGLALGGPNDPAVRILKTLGAEPAEVDAAIRRTWRAAS